MTNFFKQTNPLWDQGGSVSYWKQVAEKDNGKPTNNPHILAERILKRGGEVTHQDINLVLGHQNIRITAEQLEQLKAIPYTTYSLTSLSTIRSFFANDTWVIYMFMNQITLSRYVGSTTNIVERLKHYFKNHKGNIRLILADIRQHGITQFQLTVYIIPEHLRTPDLLLVLEQYYILSLNPSNKILKVVNGSPGGMRISAQNSITNSTSIAVTMNGLLIFVFNSMNGITNNAVNGLGATSKSIISCLNSGKLFLNIFTLTRIVDGVISESPHYMTLEDMLKLVEQARVDYKNTWKRTKPAGQPSSTTPSFKVIRLVDGSEHAFPNFNSARVWLREETGKHVDNNTITRRIASGIPLNGLLYKSYDS